MKDSVLMGIQQGMDGGNRRGIQSNANNTIKESHKHTHFK